MTFGKSINIILFDNEDFATCINEENGFTKVLLKKLRVATEKGTVFFQVKSITVSSESIGGKPKVTVTETNTTNFLKQDIRKEIEQLIFIVEGNTDQQIIKAFAERIFFKTGNKKELNIMVAGGKYSVAKLANTIQNNLLDNSKIVLVADSDNNKEETLNLLTQNLDNKRIATIIPDPEIETWLSDLNITSRKEFRNLIVHKKANILELVEKIDIEKLINRDSSFKKFYKLLTE